MIDVTKTIFEYDTNVRVYYTNELSLEDIIPYGSNILIISNSISHWVDYIATYSNISIYDVGNLLEPYLKTDKSFKRIKNISKEKYKNSLIEDINSINESSYDWVIFDLDYVRNIFEMVLGKDFYKIIKNVSKIGKNIAYIKYYDTDILDLIKYAYKIVDYYNISFTEALERILKNGPIELQIYKSGIGKIVSSFRIAGFKEVNILCSPIIKRKPYACLAKSFFIYVTQQQV
jgi:hypothetical protein